MPTKDDTKMLMLIDALRSGVPITAHSDEDDAVAEPPSSAVQRSPGHALQTAVAHPMDMDDSAYAMRPGEVALPTTYAPGGGTAILPRQPDVNVYGHHDAAMQHMPDMTVYGSDPEMQRLPPQTVHPSLWQRLLGGRPDNAPGVRQAGDESAGY